MVQCEHQQYRDKYLLKHFMKNQEGKDMPVVEELIRTEQDGTISFGNYKLDVKSKHDNFEHDGDYIR